MSSLQEKLSRWATLTPKEQMEIFTEAGVAQHVVSAKDLSPESRKAMGSMEDNHYMVTTFAGIAKFAQFVEDAKRNRKRNRHDSHFQ